MRIFFFVYCLLEYCCSAEKLLIVIFSSSVWLSVFALLVTGIKTSTDKREETANGDCLGISFFLRDGCGWVRRIVVTLGVCMCVFMEKLGLRP